MSDTVHSPSRMRRRIHLDVVTAQEATGMRVPSGTRVMYRGRGSHDYACGNCGLLIAIGVQPGVLRSLLFDCCCGATNRVPSHAVIGAH